MPVRAWKERKTLTESFRRLGAPKPRVSGLRSLPELRDSASRLLLSLTARDWPPLGWWVVVDRRYYSDGGGAGGLPRRFPVALKALPEPWQEKICDDARHGVRKFIIAAAIDGTHKDLIVICEWLLTTRQEYFALIVEGIATIVLKNGKKIVEDSIAVGHSECEQYFVLFSIVLCSSRGMNARSTVI